MASVHVQTQVLFGALAVAAAAFGCSSDGEQASSSAQSTLPSGASASYYASSTSFGDPLPGLSPSQLQRFTAARAKFDTIEDVADGLGPVFNEAACSACHSNGGVGGGSARLEKHFGLASGGAFDPLVGFGGPLVHSQGIGYACAPSGSPCAMFVGEAVPKQANVTTQRESIALFGDGLVDALEDATLESLATSELSAHPATAGRASHVSSVALGHEVVGKFGWKASRPSIHQFSGDAYLNELGVTNPEFPEESCPQGDCALLAANPVPALNDDGTDVAAFTDFTRMLAPPPRGYVTNAAYAGEYVFDRIGCADCHTPVLRTGDSDLGPLAFVSFAPFSDFLLHDMGSLGDGIPEGDAGATEMRTAPLWGLRIRSHLLHDGRATTVTDAIRAHAGQGAAAAAAFDALYPSDRARLLAFLASL